MSTHLNSDHVKKSTGNMELVKSTFLRAERLRLSGAPVVYSLGHLAKLTGVRYSFLRDVINRESKPYKHFKLPKKTGGLRSIYSPCIELQRVQRWILERILYVPDIHKNNFAYQKSITIKDCASRHVGARWMIKMDLNDYFTSIKENQVFNIFLQLGYSNLLSFELARICTWSFDQFEQQKIAVQTTHAESFVYSNGPRGYLPQGAPTSGALANLATREFDSEISNYALENQFIYTRYSDDLVFSSSQEFDRSVARQQVRDLSLLIRTHKLFVNPKKTRVISPGSRKIVLGLLVREDRVSILPEQRRMIDVYIHSVRKYGLLEFAAHRGFDSVISFINHLEGWLAHIQSIEPDWTAVRREAWHSALEEQDIWIDALR